MKLKEIDRIVKDYISMYGDKTLSVPVFYLDVDENDIKYIQVVTPFGEKVLDNYRRNISEKE